MLTPSNGSAPNGSTPDENHDWNYQTIVSDIIAQLEKQLLIKSFVKILEQNFSPVPDDLKKAVESILDSIQSEDRQNFIENSLPFILAENSRTLKLEVETLLSCINQLAVYGLFDGTLDLLIKSTSTRPSTQSLFTWANEVCNLCKEYTNFVFRMYIPNILKTFPEDTIDLDLFIKLCENAKDETPRMCRLIVTHKSIDFKEQCDFIISSLLSSFKAKEIAVAYKLAEFTPPLSVENLSTALKDVKLFNNARGSENKAFAYKRIGYAAARRASNSHHQTPASQQQDAYSTIHKLDDLLDLKQFFSAADLEKLENLIKKAAAISTNREYKTIAIITKFITLYGVADTARNLDFLSDAFCRLSDNEIKLLYQYTIEELREKSNFLVYTQGEIEYNATNYILAGMLIIDNELNGWPISESDFFTRWRASYGFNMLPVIDIKEPVSFTVKAAPEGELMHVKDRQTLNKGFIKKHISRFTLGKYEDETITNISQACEQDFGIKLTINSVFKEIVDITRNSDSFDYNNIQLIKRSFPLLATAAGFHISFTNLSQLNSDDDYYDALESLRILIDDTLALKFNSLGMKRVLINEFKKLARLDDIERELKKFAKSTLSEDWSIELLAVKNAIDEFYDQLAHTCILQHCPNDIKNNYFQLLRVVRRHDLDKLIGSVYLAFGEIKNDEGSVSKIVVMAGGGLRRTVQKSLAIGEFYSKLIHKLRQTVVKLGYEGLYQAVGQPTETETWTEEGRIGQNKEVIKAIMPKNPEFITLAQPIYFPTEYEKGPIQRVVKL